MPHSHNGPGRDFAPSAEPVFNEQFEWCQRAMAKLGIDSRRVLHWRHRDNLSFEEIARQLIQSEDGAVAIWADAVCELAQKLHRCSEHTAVTAVLDTNSRDGTAEPADLAAYDEQLRRCLRATDGEAKSRRQPSPELVECLHLLERVWPRADAAPAPPGLPTHIGRFEIQKVLGHGGFGIVYLASDPALKRALALKVPRSYVQADERSLNRFRREARAAAGLDHPNVVPIHDTGEAGGNCYIASAYCAGPNLAQWLKQHDGPVPSRLAAALVQCLAEAVHYSHGKGVLHLDLKPGNVLLAPLPSDRPKREGELPFVPRLTDFGLARLADEDLAASAASAMLGTPAYMAPEQAGGSGADIGPATDVYGLGVILHELLTGHPPFRGESIADVLDQIRRSDPVPLRKFRRDIPRDLETVCLKCLEKSAAQRYATAQALADDLRRFLHGEPLLAKPPPAARLMMKWVRRRPLAALLMATIALVAVGLPAILAQHNRQLTKMTRELEDSLDTAHRWQTHADEQRERAEQAAREAEEQRGEAESARKSAEAQRKSVSEIAYASSVRLAEMAWRNSDIRQSRALLDAAARQTDAGHAPGLSWHFVEMQTHADFREIGSALGQLSAIAISPNGRTVAAGGAGGLVQVIDVETGVTQKLVLTRHGHLRGLAFSASGDRLATCGDSKVVTVWNPRNGKQLAMSPHAPGNLQSVAWVLDDEWIAAARGFPGVRLWKVSSRTETADLNTGSEAATAISATRDGRRLAAGGGNGTIWIWDAATRELLLKFHHGAKKIICLMFSDDGRRLAAGDTNQLVRVYDASRPKDADELELKLMDDVRSLAFSPDGRRLAVLEQFGTLQVFTLALEKSAAEQQRAPRRGWLAHEERGGQLAMFPNGSKLVSVGRGSSRARIFDVDAPKPIRLLSSPPTKGGFRLPLLFTTDSRQLIAAGRGIEFWSVESLERQAVLGNEQTSREHLALSQDGRWLAAASSKPELVELWDVAEMRSAPVWEVANQKVDNLAFSPDGELIAIANWTDDMVAVLERATGHRVTSFPARQCHRAVFTPDGRYLAVDDMDDIVIRSTTSWNVVSRLHGHLSTINALDFSPDGRWLASAGQDREIRIWSTDGWKLAHALHGHSANIEMLRFTPDGRSLTALDHNDFIKVWHPFTGLEMCNLRTPTEVRTALFALSPDTRRLAVRLRDGRVEMHRLRND